MHETTCLQLASNNLQETDRLLALTFHVQLLENYRERDRAKISKLNETLQRITVDADRYKKLRNEANAGYVAQLRANDELQTQLEECRRALAKMRESKEKENKANVWRQTVHSLTDKLSLSNEEVQQYAQSILNYSTMSEEIYDYCRTANELVAIYFHNIGSRVNDIDEAKILQAMEALKQAK